MHELHELREMLCDELNKITKQGKMSTGLLDMVDKLTHSIKSIDTIVAMEESGYSNDYSRDGYSRRGSYDGSYDGGSYGRDGYAMDDGYSGRIRKDGRRDQRYNYSRDSYDRGYSRDLKEDLEHIMRKTNNEEEKRMIKKFIRELGE